MKRKELAEKIYQVLLQIFPNPKCALNHASTFELLVATILSAQCTDERVNQVTPMLFKEFGTVNKMAKAPLERVEELIHSTGFYKAKAHHLVTMANQLLTSFKGEIPQTLEELITLNGVGRKTANVILGNAFGINEGVVVDTHVKRLSGRLKFSKASTPEKIEKDLMTLFPRERWTILSHLLILHGRAHCKARNPSCSDCPIKMLCPSREV